MRRHAVLKIDYLRDISRDKAVKRSAILFESIRLDVRIYSRLNFVDDLSCIDFCSLLQKIKHIGALLLLAKQKRTLNFFCIEHLIPFDFV